jgi:group I intron endonuclease
MNSGIYIIYFNNIPNKFYVGYSINLSARKNQHFSRLRLRTHDNSRLQQAFIDSGEEPEFEVLEYVEPNPVLLGNREIYWI